jgi:hypothetical protein
MQPRFKKFRKSFYTKITKLLGFNFFGEDLEKNETFQKIKTLVDGMADGKIHPAIVYRELLAMKKLQDEKLAEEATKMAEAKAKETAIDTTAAADSTISVDSSVVEK